MAGNEVQHFAIKTVHIGEQTTAQDDRISHNGFENSPRVRARRADYTKDFAGSTLLLKRLAQLQFKAHQLPFYIRPRVFHVI